MRNPLKRMGELIPLLPGKDAKLCANYLSERNFECILEIVESDIYKAKRKNSDELPDDYLSTLIELKGELVTYMSYLDVSDYSNDYDNY